jgi:DNA-directed RNA polymerase specialized sigma24 family protein
LDKSTAKPTIGKRDWLLNQSSFKQLLNWLDQESDSGGERYVEMRNRLVSYFDRKNCASPDDLADETLNRVARRLEEKGEVVTDSPAHYCYIVARFVLLEYLREEKRRAPLDENLTHVSPESAVDQLQWHHHTEQRWECLENCISRLDPEQRHLIVNYYRGDQRAKIEKRRALAAGLGVTANALAIRACRIRDRLADCVRNCMNEA